MEASPPPVIVLVRPQLGQNIGKAARAMLNFGLTEMRLVAPRDGWPNPDAGPSASGADIVLEKAQVFDSVEEAIADCSTIYASTVRRRDLVMPVLTPTAMAGEIAQSSGGTASEWGSRFVERVLSVTATCRQQGRNVLEFLTDCFRARSGGRPAPSLIV